MHRMSIRLTFFGGLSALIAIVLVQSGENLFQTHSILPGGPEVIKLERNSIERPVKQVASNAKSISLLVTDILGRNITGLTTDNFEILKGAVPQTIIGVAETRPALSVVFVISHLNRLHGNWPEMLRSLQRTIVPIESRDEAWLVNANEANIVAHRLHAGETFPSFNKTRQSNLTEALILGAQQLRNSRSECRIVVIISDGCETNEHYAPREVAASFNNARVQLVVTLKYDRYQDQDRKRDHFNLYSLLFTEAPIDLYLAPPNTLRAQVARLSTLMRYQYTLTYTPIHRITTPEPSKINIKVTIKNIRSINIYYA